METYFIFIVKASFCLSAFYLIGLWVFRRNRDFRMQRIYWLVSIALSLSLPFNQVSINLYSTEKIETIQPHFSPDLQVTHNFSTPPDIAVSIKPESVQPIEATYPLKTLLEAVYWSLMIFFVVRIFYGFLCIALYVVHSEWERHERYTIAFHKSIKGSFTFLKWIFLNAELKNKIERQNILTHEMVHANQYHSLDIIVIELLSAVMWFNPIIWLMRRRMQQLHEYLADEGVIRSGINVLEYQALLVNQVAGDRLIRLPSGFNQSLLKKRLAMMTTTGMNRRSWYHLLTLIPVAGLIFMTFSFTNKATVNVQEKAMVKPLRLADRSTATSVNHLKNLGSFAEVGKDTLKEMNLKPPKQMIMPPPPPPIPDTSGNLVVAVAPTKMNVFYLGVDNPVSIAVSGVPSDKIFVEINNGEIHKVDNGYVVEPKQVGQARIKVFSEVKDKKVPVGIMDFRVKKLPNPVVYVAGKRGGSVSLNKLLEADKVSVFLENFDFDAAFTVTEFTLSAIVSGIKKEIKSNSETITAEQKELLKTLHSGDQLYFSGITAKGPDGSSRTLSPLVLTIE